MLRRNNDYDVYVCFNSVSKELPDMCLGVGSEKAGMHAVRWWISEDNESNLRLCVLYNLWADILF